MTIDNSQNVGIGTQTVRALLDVVNGINNTNADSSNVMNVVGPNQTTNQANLAVTTNDGQAINLGGSIALGGRYSTTGQAHFARIKAGKENSSSGEYGGYLGFFTRVHGAGNIEQVRIQPDGDVGIGTVSPGTKLDVYGDLTVRDADSTIVIGDAGTNASKLYAGASDSLYIGSNNTYQFRFQTGQDGVLLRDANFLSMETFVSGITGDGFRIIDGVGDGVSLEIDNIIVRNTLRTHIFQKDVVKATNGILFVSDSGVIDYATATQVKFRADKSATFPDTTLMWYKDADEDTGTINSVKFTIDSLVGTTSNITTYNVTYDSGTWTNIATGSTAARFSGGTITIDASSANSPYIDINASSGSAVVRMGNLAGISTGAFTPGSVYGFWASGSAYFEGTVNATAGGIIGGWTIGSASLSSGDVNIDSNHAKIIAGNLGTDVGTSNIRAVFGKFDGVNYGLRVWDGINTYVKLSSDGLNEIAGWDIVPGRLQYNNTGGSIALDATNQRIAIYTGSVDENYPKVVMGNLPTTGASYYGFAVFSGASAADISQPDTYSVLITKDAARLAGWDLVPGQLTSGTVADINGNQASIALGTGATSATGTPTDGLFFVSASTSPVFYVGSNFSYIDDVLTAGGWKIGNGIISSSASPDTDGVILDATNKVLTFHGATGKDSFWTSRDNVKLAVGQISSGIYGMIGYDASGNTLLELSETQALIAG